MPTIEILGGGTVSHVRNHLALCAPAFGETARRLGDVCYHFGSPHYSINVHMTKMAGGKEGLETNDDVEKLVDRWIADKNVRIVIFNPALVDYEGSILTSGPVGYEWSDDITTANGKYEQRLETSKGEQKMLLWPSKKLLGKIRKERKDIFLVAFKTTCGASADEQFLSGLHLLKKNSCNLVLANDTKTRTNMIITPEQARYYVTTDRDLALRGLVEMTLARADSTFTRSNVVPGESVPWDMENIPHSLKDVVEHCIAKGAYKPFNGSTVGHFAFKKSETDFVTSKRRVNFNKLPEVGMVLCHSEGPNDVTAYGAKPSVGGQSQRIIFNEHPGMDCIVHFHCPPKPGVTVPTRRQLPYECGSHQCGKNTSDGLKEVEAGIKCVYLDNHGPNIVFNHKTSPREVIDFIDHHFDLSQSTDQVDRTQIVVS